MLVKQFTVSHAGFLLNSLTRLLTTRVSGIVYRHIVVGDFVRIMETWQLQHPVVPVSPKVFPFILDLPGSVCFVMTHRHWQSFESIVGQIIGSARGRLSYSASKIVEQGWKFRIKSGVRLRSLSPLVCPEVCPFFRHVRRQLDARRKSRRRFLIREPEERR